VREAVAALREATANQVDDPINVKLGFADGEPTAEVQWVSSAAEFMRGAQVPPQFWGHRIVLQLSFSGEPTVTAYDSNGRLVWEKARPDPARNGHARPSTVGPAWEPPR
jgi:hypothetical protein